MAPMAVLRLITLAAALEEGVVTAVAGSLMIRTVAGGSLRTPARIVRGAGTTEWNVR